MVKKSDSTVGTGLGLVLSCLACWRCSAARARALEMAVDGGDGALDSAVRFAASAKAFETAVDCGGGAFGSSMRGRAGPVRPTFTIFLSIASDQRFVLSRC